MHITVVLPVLYGCETWFLTLREEHKLRVQDDGENCLMRILLINTLSHVLWWTNQWLQDSRCM